MSHQNCCCPDCVAARRIMVQNTHPILSHMHDEPGPTLIPIAQALCMELEIVEELEARLNMAKQNVKALRDCA